MRRRVRRASAWLAGGLFVLYLGLEALALTLSVRRGQHDEAFLGLGALALAAVGALVALRRPSNPIGWIMLAIANLSAFSALGEGWYVSAPDPASLPFGTAMLWVSQWITWLWLGLAVLILPLFFPDGRLPSRRWRLAVWLVTLSIVLTALTDALKPGPLEADDSAAVVENPLGASGTAADVVDGLRPFALAFFALALATALAAIVIRFRRAHGDERQQLKWFAYVGALMAVGFTAAALSLVVATVLGWDTEDLPTWLEAVGAVGWMTGLGTLTLGLPVAIGLAVLKYRLYDIDVVINRTLVYGLLTALLAASYLGLVLLFQLALGPVTEGNGVAIALSTLAVAALFRPARRRVQELVDRRFYRSRYDAQRTLEAFASRLREQVDLDALRGELTRVAAETMRPEHVSLWLREEAR